MGRHVNIDCPRLPVPFTYKGNSIYHSVVVPRRTDEQDCRDLITILRWVERAGKNNLDCTFVPVQTQ